MIHASDHGLGTCLVQQGKPIAYASRAMTDTESNYAQIEKELLAIVYGMEKFETFVYGQHVVVQSDHKPLETIFRKALYLADTLSRAYLTDDSSLSWHSRHPKSQEQVVKIERSSAE